MEGTYLLFWKTVLRGRFLHISTESFSVHKCRWFLYKKSATLTTVIIICLGRFPRGSPADWFIKCSSASHLAMTWYFSRNWLPKITFNPLYFIALTPYSQSSEVRLILPQTYNQSKIETDLNKWYFSSTKHVTKFFPLFFCYIPTSYSYAKKSVSLNTSIILRPPQQFRKNCIHIYFLQEDE